MRFDAVDDFVPWAREVCWKSPDDFKEEERGGKKGEKKRKRQKEAYDRKLGTEPPFLACTIITGSSISIFWVQCLEEHSFHFAATQEK
jgi:hypothetical protein